MHVQHTHTHTYSDAVFSVLINNHFLHLTFSFSRQTVSDLNVATQYPPTEYTIQQSPDVSLESFRDPD